MKGRRPVPGGIRSGHLAHPGSGQAFHCCYSQVCRERIHINSTFHCKGSGDNAVSGRRKSPIALLKSRNGKVPGTRGSRDTQRGYTAASPPLWVHSGAHYSKRDSANSGWRAADQPEIARVAPVRWLVKTLVKGTQALRSPPTLHPVQLELEFVAYRGSLQSPNRLGLKVCGTTLQAV